MIGLLLVAAFFTLSSGEISENSVERAIRDTGFNVQHNVVDPGKGYSENCGKAKNFSLTWSPKKQFPRAPLFIDMNFVTPYAWHYGLVIIALYMKEMSDMPIIQENQQFFCDDLKTLPPQVVCPFKANDLVHLSYRTEMLPEFSIPPGIYKMKLRILNENEEEVFCAIAEVPFEQHM